jgi:hypothetical protein
MRGLLAPLCLAASMGLLPVAETSAQESAAASAQAAPAETAAQPVRSTGDAWLDARLADIDRYAARYPDAFADELERYAGVPREYVGGLLAQPRWAGGDAWFACFLARAVQATCRSVVRTRTRLGPEADWEAVAAEFDAAPGSDAYPACAWPWPTATGAGTARCSPMPRSGAPCASARRRSPPPRRPPLHRRAQRAPGPADPAGLPADRHGRVT